MENELNYKNLLQEYCQKHKLPLPKYETVQIPESPAHQPSFFVKLKFQTVNGNILTSQQVKSGTKKTVEMAVARKIWQKLQNHIQTSKKVYPSDIPTLVLIDLENQQTILDDLLTHLDLDQSNIQIYLYASESSPLALQAKEKKTWQHQKIHLSICPSTRSDAADTYLIYSAGILTANSPKKNQVLIFSGDHFAKTLEECLSFNNHPSLATISLEKGLKFLENQAKID